MRTTVDLLLLLSGPWFHVLLTCRLSNLLSHSWQVPCPICWSLSPSPLVSCMPSHNHCCILIDEPLTEALGEFPIEISFHQWSPHQSLGRRFSSRIHHSVRLYILSKLYTLLSNMPLPASTLMVFPVPTKSKGDSKCEDERSRSHPSLYPSWDMSWMWSLI